ncbi:MAG: biosynthetic arginine decarboxylase, partial [Cephaloticoccus sp.]|nr:biosynthetic arginine decarboxylase [Cephaloticoccus sp.]
LDLILKHAAKHSVRPTFGVRVKLAARGAGRWQASAGHRSKFGLTISEVLRVIERLRELDMLDCLQLLHFHLGSQVTNIRSIKSALIEAARIYCDLHHRGAGLKYLDVGGGLGVDYDGSRTNFESSMNYTLQEYANDVVFHVESVCRESEVPHPTIISESGRAIAAYHSALIVPVLGVSGKDDDVELRELEEDAPEPLRFLDDAYRCVNTRTLLESYHDAQQGLDMAVNLFSFGHLSLDDRCYAEQLFWKLCRKIRLLMADLDFIPEELRGLDRMLSEIYFCNFSVFQSIPDSWAIKQLFPVMPIHRLEQQPTRHAVLGDITCDSDGKINSFIDLQDVKDYVQLHPLNNKPYYLGIFLTGAYQDIMGDLHNLFGRVNEVHVFLEDDEHNGFYIEETLNGSRIGDVIEGVQYRQDDLCRRMKRQVDEATRRDMIKPREGIRLLELYESQMLNKTYLNIDTHAARKRRRSGKR